MASTMEAKPFSVWGLQNPCRMAGSTARHRMGNHTFLALRLSNSGRGQPMKPDASIVLRSLGGGLVFSFRSLGSY